jgi:hypothetical protein
MKPTEEKAKLECGKRGYTYVAYETVAGRTYVYFTCDKKHHRRMLLSKMVEGRNCGACFGPEPLRLVTVVDLLRQKGYSLLSVSYKNNSTPLKFKCSKNHIFEMSLDAFKARKTPCKKCSGKDHETKTEIIKKAVEQEGYELLEPYTGSKYKLHLRCPHGKDMHVRWVHWHNCGVRCGCKSAI